MSRISDDWTPELQEALWETSKEYGIQLPVGAQVAIARDVARSPLETVSPEDLRKAFGAIGLKQPSLAYARAVLSSVKGVQPKASILDVLLEYRQFAIRELSAQFGGKTTGNEEALRNNLLTFLPQRGYTEARTGKGRTDIILPPPDDAIIETKVWTTELVYRDGVEELGRYIHTAKPRHAFLVVFGDREPLPKIVDTHTQTCAQPELLEGLTVPVVVVPFEETSPSTVGRKRRKRERT